MRRSTQQTEPDPPQSAVSSQVRGVSEHDAAHDAVPPSVRQQRPASVTGCPAPHLTDRGEVGGAASAEEVVPVLSVPYTAQAGASTNAKATMTASASRIGIQSSLRSLLARRRSARRRTSWRRAVMSL